MEKSRSGKRYAAVARAGKHRLTASVEASDVDRGVASLVLRFYAHKGDTRAARIVTRGGLLTKTTYSGGVSMRCMALAVVSGGDVESVAPRVAGLLVDAFVAAVPPSLKVRAESTAVTDLSTLLRERLPFDSAGKRNVEVVLAKFGPGPTLQYANGVAYDGRETEPSDDDLSAVSFENLTKIKRKGGET